ncbi:hypothetical protein ACQKMY_06505, partial [Peribacillus frigoritolerans]|uniref:hypothetical protein n=1 Tax=Peribacillus frigoritolerans TaxID=450367 RepID=UPI003CFCAB77
MASQDGDDREVVALILIPLKALSNKIKNSIKKTLRLARQDGDDREVVALILIPLKALSNKIKNSIKKTLR